jgi:hypothetical protein
MKRETYEVVHETCSCGWYYIQNVEFRSKRTTATGSSRNGKLGVRKLLIKIPCHQAFLGYSDV